MSIGVEYTDFDSYQYSVSGTIHSRLDFFPLIYVCKTNKHSHTNSTKTHKQTEHTHKQHKSFPNHYHINPLSYIT